MKRSSYKLPFIANIFFKKNVKKITRNLTLNRSSNIPFHLINRKVSVYNGAWLLTHKIEESMVGIKFGELFLTKRYNRQSQAKVRGKRKVKK